MLNAELMTRELDLREAAEEVLEEIETEGDTIEEE
jgi:hypothetical protein